MSVASAEFTCNRSRKWFCYAISGLTVTAVTADADPPCQRHGHPLLSDFLKYGGPGLEDSDSKPHTSR